MRRRTVMIGTAAGLALSGLGGYGIAAAGEGAGPSGASEDQLHGQMMRGSGVQGMHRSMMRDPESRKAMRSPEMRAMHREMHEGGR